MKFDENISDVPYWWHESPPKDINSKTFPTKVEVLIVGSGFSGLGAAIPLLRAGNDVAIIDKNLIGMGAATRNGGITSGNIRVSYSKLKNKFGEKKALQFFKEGILAREDLYNFIAKEKIDCDFKLVGRFLGIKNEIPNEILKRENHYLTEKLGINLNIVNKKNIKNYIDSDKYSSGVYRDDIGGIHPAKLLHGMLKITLKEGGKIFSNTTVKNIKRKKQLFYVSTSKGIIISEHVIVATNAYTGKEFPWLRRRLVPVISEIISTERIGNNFVKSLMPKFSMFSESMELGYYYRPSPDGNRIILGGRRLHNNPTEARKRLRDGLIEIFPQLNDIKLSNHWFGFVAFPFDQLPKLVVNDGIIYPSGFCGSGTVWARWLGQKAAGMILGNKSYTIFSDLPFKTLPFYNGYPWFLPLAMNYYKLRDRFSRTSK